MDFSLCSGHQSLWAVLTFASPVSPSSLGSLPELGAQQMGLSPWGHMQGTGYSSQWDGAGTPWSLHTQPTDSWVAALCLWVLLTKPPHRTSLWTSSWMRQDHLTDHEPSGAQHGFQPPGCHLPPGLPHFGEAATMGTGSFPPKDKSLEASVSSP